MIVVDTSVLVAILREEDDAADWIDVFDRTSKSLMSVVSYVETSMVIYGRARDTNPNEVTDLIEALQIEIMPVSLEQGGAAVAAFLQYGKGRHRAGLNLADCFSYALARVRRAPLLYKGNDFTMTDVVPAWQSQ
jgi:ribonuclease VapC